MWLREATFIGKTAYQTLPRDTTHPQLPGLTLLYLRESSVGPRLLLTVVVTLLG